LNDAKNQSVFPLLGLLYDDQQFKSGGSVFVADVSINEVNNTHAYAAFISAEDVLQYLSTTDTVCCL